MPQEYSAAALSDELGQKQISNKLEIHSSCHSSVPNSCLK